MSRGSNGRPGPRIYQSLMRTMGNIESSPKGHPVKLFVRGSTHYGPLRQCMSEAQGDLERVRMAGDGANQNCSVRQIGENRLSQRHVRESLDQHRRRTWSPQRQFRMAGSPNILISCR